MVMDVTSSSLPLHSVSYSSPLPPHSDDFENNQLRADSISTAASSDSITSHTLMTENMTGNGYSNPQQQETTSSIAQSTSNSINTTSSNHGERMYYQAQPDRPAASSPGTYDYFYTNNNRSMMSGQDSSNRSMLTTSSVNHYDFNSIDARSSQISDPHQLAKPMKNSTNINNDGGASGQQYPVFPPSDEIRKKAFSKLLAVESSFKVIYAGDATYKPDKGILTKTKRAHFVLTNTHLLLYKSSQKARVEINIFEYNHSSSGFNHSFGATGKSSTTNKLFEKDRVFLTLPSVYAVHSVATQLCTFRIEYLHDQSGQALSHTITAESYKECKQWIDSLRSAVSVYHLRMDTINSTERFTVIERLSKQNDAFANTDHVKMYKVVFKEKRYKTGSNVPREIFLPVILAIGKLSLYFLPVNVLDEEYLKAVERDRFGLLSIQSIKYENVDDTVIIEVKQVGKSNRQLVFASTFCEEIVQYLYRGIESIIPFSQYSFSQAIYTPLVPPHIRLAEVVLFTVPVDPDDTFSEFDDEEVSRFNTTLRAYCAAMNLNKARFSYTISGPLKAKNFTLLPPNEIGATPATYQKYELLAILRTLLYNNAFVEVSFANCSFEALETWVAQKDHGWTMYKEKVSVDDNILFKELLAILITLFHLRKIDLTNCSIGKSSAMTGLRNTPLNCIGVAMRSGKTHISRISIGKNRITISDADNLIMGITEHRKSIKEINLEDCGLNVEMAELVIKTLLRQSPEQVIRIDLSTTIPDSNKKKNDGDDDGGHKNMVNPMMIEKMIPAFRRLECLRMKGYNLLSADYDFKLESSHLRELDLGGEKIFSDTVARLCRWIQTHSFQTIEALHLAECGLNGTNVHDILTSISRSGNRNMHLDLENNPVMKGDLHLVEFQAAIIRNEGPKSISLARIEWTDSSLREFVDCLRDNENITHLNLSDIMIANNDKVSENTVRMLTYLLERNTHINKLELNYKYNKAPPRVPDSGAGKLKSSVCNAIVQSLHGLRGNRTLRHLDISGLGMEDTGIMSLIRVLKTNRHLQSISLDDNNLSIDSYRSLKKVVEESATQVVSIPIPRNDIRAQIGHLSARVRTLMLSENEIQFFLIHTTSSDKKKAKKHEVEMLVQERKACEVALQNLETVIYSLLAATRKNLVENEEQLFQELSVSGGGSQAGTQDFNLPSFPQSESNVSQPVTGFSDPRDITATAVNSSTATYIGYTKNYTNSSAASVESSGSNNSSRRRSSLSRSSSRYQPQNQSQRPVNVTGGWNNRRSMFSTEYSSSITTPINFSSNNSVSSAVCLPNDPTGGSINPISLTSLVNPSSPISPTIPISPAVLTTPVSPTIPLHNKSYTPTGSFNREAVFGRSHSYENKISHDTMMARQQSAPLPSVSKEYNNSYYSRQPENNSSAGSINSPQRQQQQNYAASESGSSINAFSYSNMLLSEDDQKSITESTAPYVTEFERNGGSLEPSAYSAQNNMPSRSRAAIWNEEQLAKQFSHSMHLPPNGRY